MLKHAKINDSIMLISARLVCVNEDGTFIYDNDNYKIKILLVLTGNIFEVIYQDIYLNLPNDCLCSTI